MKYSILSITLLLLLIGCTQPEIQEENRVQEVKQATLPPPPSSKPVKLKDVNDTNFDPSYMYPQTDNKKASVDQSIQTAVASGDSMDKAQCIAMITQEKFDKYAAMFGSEAASIKRCKMLKATQL